MITVDIFEPFPKMARLTRECVITEKIDGTNAQVFIAPAGVLMPVEFQIAEDAEGRAMFAGSRTRFITPESDNFGFAAWVKANASDLFKLGEGRHFGEWWGPKIQRGYGLAEKRFSLFNTTRWMDRHTESGVVGNDWPATELRFDKQWAPACCYVVPELYRGLFSDRVVDNMLAKLRHEGSVAAPGFMQPEGIVIFHVAAGSMFKKTLEHDEKPKGAVAA